MKVSADHCATIYAHRPPDIQGSINLKEARFLHGLLLERRPRTIAEIGTCSGLSTAVMADALFVLNEADDGARRVYSYDLLERLYFDPTREVGFFLATLPPRVQANVILRTRCTALDLRHDFAPGSLEFLLIDANHAHPWPCLDLLACLPLLAGDATVVLHDINLPLIHPAHTTQGAKLAFDALPLPKRFCEPMKDCPPNMGAVQLAGNTEAIHKTLIDCICSAPWETTVERDWLEQAGLFASLAGAWRANAGRADEGIVYKIARRVRRIFL